MAPGPSEGDAPDGAIPLGKNQRDVPAPDDADTHFPNFVAGPRGRRAEEIRFKKQIRLTEIQTVLTEVRSTPGLAPFAFNV